MPLLPRDMQRGRQCNTTRIAAPPELVQMHTVHSTMASHDLFFGKIVQATCTNQWASEIML